MDGERGYRMGKWGTGCERGGTGWGERVQDKEVRDGTQLTCLLLRLCSKALLQGHCSVLWAKGVGQGRQWVGQRRQC